jgi:hypothetical protein
MAVVVRLMAFSLVEFAGGDALTRRAQRRPRAGRRSRRIAEVSPRFRRAATGAAEIPGRARFAVPDAWGAGLAYRSAGGALTLAGEIDRVGYEGLLRIESVEGEEVEGREYRDA